MMQIKVILDRDTLDRNLHTGFGVSFLINDKILFDTADNSRLLINNMENLGIDFNKLEAVVISHDHWDHTDGLREVIKRKPGLKVFACPHFSVGFKKKLRSLGGDLVESANPEEIAKDIYVTGEIAGRHTLLYISEQALVIKSENGISVITGCAHPGIIEILKKVKENFPKEDFYLVCGGFHLGGRRKQDVDLIAEGFKRMGAKKAGPTHCTGEEAIGIFRNKYKDGFISLKAGQTIDL